MARYIDREKVCEKCNNKNYCEKEKCPVYKVPTADVVPKSEVEKLEQANEDLRNVLTNTINKYRNCETETAREIFEEIEKHGRKMQSSDFSGDFWDIAVLMTDIAELKKKYTAHPIENSERCVVCGAVIPEGRQVCPMCEKQNTKGGLQ